MSDTAARRLRAWKAQKPFGDASRFEARLAADSLSERDLVLLLAEPAEALKARTPEVPEWLVALRDAFTSTSGEETSLPLLAEAGGDHPLRGCLRALEPLLRLGLTSLRERLDSLSQQFEHVPVDERTMTEAFTRNIAPTVLFQASKPLVLEMHVARLRGRLRGETPEARRAEYMRQLSDDGLMISLLAKYPVLARQLLVTIQQFADYLGEFATHLCADWQALRETFTGGTNPGALLSIDAGHGDRHRRGRSVLVLRFSGGSQLVYKPKSLAVDVHFAELLSWLNERGADPPLRAVSVLARGDYGWSEFVPASSCASEEEVTRFYERQGGYLALLYALDAVDLHNENLIAAGEHPLLVDLEALFHPYVEGADRRVPGNLAANALDRSVWQVGLLPRRVWSDEDSIGVDMSGLGGESGQMNPHRLLSWESTDADDLRLGRERVELPVGDNRPRLNGRHVDVLDYKDALLRGFTMTYRLLCRHRDELTSEWLPRFARDPVRVVVRSTNVYGLLLYESFHPDLLRDALDRDRFFDRLWAEAAQRRFLERVIPAERRDLWRGDIPWFGTTPDSRTLFRSEHAALRGFFDRPSLERVQERIGHLGDDDLRKQTWIIEASLATLIMDREPIGSRRQRPPRDRPVDEERLLRVASSIGERLGELAFSDDTGASWLGVGPLDESTWGLYPSGLDLYAGTSGIALFLAHLGAITGEPAHTRLARAALASVRAHGRAWVEPSGGGDGPPVGAFEGVASIVYLLANLGVLWTEPALLDEAADLADRLPPLISRDGHLDVIYGSAGCILALLSLEAVHPATRALEVAVQAGDRLLATGRPMARGIAWTTLEGQPELGGFSHGTAGIAFSLLRLAARSGQARFRHAALQALEFDRSLFLPELSNWADLRVLPRRTGSNPQSMVAWCHGAPGIGLGRLAALDVLDDATIRREIDTALDATIDYGFDMNHSLCHGAMGNLELLLMAAQRLDRPRDREALEWASRRVVGDIEANGPVTGVPLGVETPGFMTGLAGIGYELLRLAEPDRVPSALVLAPPRREAPIRGER